MDIFNYILILRIFGVILAKMPPFAFIVRPHNMTVNIGDSIVLECTSNANSMYYTWEYKPHKDFSNKDGSVLGFCYRGQQCVVKIWNDQLKITNISQLSLQNISNDNSGQYICESTPMNGYDIIKTSAFIFVRTPPKSISIDFNKSQNMFSENESIVIKCSVYGSNPIPKVSISIVANNNVSHLKIEPANLPLSHTNEVNVHALWRPSYSQNRGFVMCTAINDAGFLTKNSSLVNIKFEPKIHSFKYSNISAMINQTLDILCDVTSNPAATIQWILNNGLRIISSPQLVTKVLPEMAGNLTCIAKNSMGSREHTLELVVLRDPVINILAVNKVKEHSDVSVSCQVVACPDPDFIKWYKLSSNSNNNSILISNDGKLNFIKIDRSSTGKYACITKNTQRPTFGEFKEVSVQKYLELLVTYLPGEPVIRSDEEVKVQKGEQLQILCSVNNKAPGEPFPTLFWIDVDTRSIVSNSYDLYVSKVTSIHNGNYKCVATNELGITQSSKTVTISVYEPPILISQNESNIVIRYSFLPKSITLPCSFQGQPLHTVKWHYQKERLSTTTDYQITTSRKISPERSTILSSNLIIKLYSPNFSIQYSIKSPPSGTYSCESINEFGRAFFEYNLIIRYPPLIKISRHERKVAGILSQISASLKCQMESIEPPQISWIRASDSKKLSNQENRYEIITSDIYKYNYNRDIFAPGVKITELKIFDLIRSDFTGYSCVATNDQGTSKGFVELVFRSRPDAPYDVKVISVEWDSITINWMSGFNGGNEQSFEINVYSEPFGPQNVPFYSDKIINKLTLKGLHPNTNYSIQLYAVNTIGKSDGSAIFTCFTKRIAKFDNIYARILSDQPKVAVIVPDVDMCANLDYTRDNGRQWFNVEYCVKFNTTQVNVTVYIDIRRTTSIYDLQTGLVHLRFTFCLLSRPSICSNQMVLENPKLENFTTQTMILVIAVICFILLIILVVLFIMCCVRTRCSCKTWLCYYCLRKTYHRSHTIQSRSLINKRTANKQDIINEGRIRYDENIDDAVVGMESPSNYCSSLIGCSSPHVMNSKLPPRHPNDIYSSFTCQHQSQPHVYYEGSSFLQPTLFSWPQTLSTQSYEVSSSNSHSSAGSSSRTLNPKSCIKYRNNHDILSNNVINNQKLLLELNEKIQLPDVTSEAIHFVKSLDTEHMIEAIV